MKEAQSSNRSCVASLASMLGVDAYILLLLLLSALPTGSRSVCYSQEVVFDSFTSGTTNTWFGEPVAQGFHIGENRALAGVTLGLERFGDPVGKVEVELWDNHGDLPGTRIATLGTIDDFTTYPKGPFQEQQVEFKSGVPNLEPNSIYWVVLVSNILNTSFPGGPTSWTGFGWNVPSVASIDEEVEAVWLGPLGRTDPPGERDDWSSISDDFGANLAFLKMSVLALPEIADPSVDCNEDGVINVADLVCVATIESRDMVLSVIHSLPGDLNGNGDVSFGDFLVLAANFGKAPASYTDGNIDLADEVDFKDFLLLSNNFEMTTAQVVSVPEPSGLVLVACIAVISRFGRSRFQGTRTFQSAMSGTCGTNLHSC